MDLHKENAMSCLSFPLPGRRWELDLMPLGWLEQDCAGTLGWEQAMQLPAKYRGSADY